jgi:hypothetical protein
MAHKLGTRRGPPLGYDFIDYMSVSGRASIKLDGRSFSFGLPLMTVGSAPIFSGLLFGVAPKAELSSEIVSNIHNASLKQASLTI